MVWTKHKIVSVCKWLHQSGWLAACDGNVSALTEKGTLWITPSAVHKGFITAEDLCEVTLDNRVLSGKASSERLMHLEIYNSCPKAKAVVHAHPPTATAWSVAKPELQELPSKSLSEVILAVGSIPIVPYARPGTEDMGSVLKPFLPHNRVMILGCHGAVAWGETIEEAYNGIERLEHSAKVLMYALSMGGLSELPSEEISYLRGLRQKIGEKTL